MPSSVNGIGTHYYGKRNRVRMTGTCESCNRVGALESYETREYFIIIFIPIIPLKRFQILDSCPFCLRHRRMELQAFAEQRESMVEAARLEAERNPSDWDLQETYAATLAGWFMLDHAVSVWQTLVARDGRRPSVHFGLARTFSYMGRHDEALASYAQCVSLDPQHDLALIEYSDLLEQRRRKAESLEILRQHEAQNSDSIAFMATLGDRAFAHKDWQTAARVYARLVQLAPEFSQDKRFMKTLKKAHKKAGLPYAGMM